MISYPIFKPVLSRDNDLWVFDQYHFKDAVTLLFLNHHREKDEHDLELKKLISLYFNNEVEMITWVKELFEAVRSLSVHAI